jgi:hypothetical protein
MTDEVQPAAEPETPASPAVPVLSVAAVKAVMASIEHDIIGQAHNFYHKLAALVAEAEKAV